ncbi:MAG: prolipoprotein diacylglyceryl transferase [Microbacteriaceae bacterium]|nr:prolipoprotein diacylglyceryl transferase [Microbacteriaceae bacterium]
MKPLDSGLYSPAINSIDLGVIEIRFYALFILTGMVVAVIVMGRRLRSRGFDSGAALSIALWAVPFGIIGARVYHVVTHPTDYFFEGADLWKVFAIWEGGIAIFGAVLAGSIGLWIAARQEKIGFLDAADALAPGLLLAQAIGRMGNYVNQELFGTPTTLPWGLHIDSGNPAIPAGTPEGTLFHPLFLYELLWNLLGVAVIIAAERLWRARREPRASRGLALGLYLVWYGVGRAWFNTFRLDPTEFELLGVKINVVTAVIAAIVGIVLVILVVAKRLPLTTELAATAPESTSGEAGNTSTLTRKDPS